MFFFCFSHLARCLVNFVVKLRLYFFSPAISSLCILSPLLGVCPPPFRTRRPGTSVGVGPKEGVFFVDGIVASMRCYLERWCPGPGGQSLDLHMVVPIFLPPIEFAGACEGGYEGIRILISTPQNTALSLETPVKI